MKKHDCYQDYVIKDGQFIGEFEEMYQDYKDPWEQTTREIFSSEKTVALNLIQKYNCKKVLELGCGLGHYTHKIQNLGVDVLGIDISPTAIKKAMQKYPNSNFKTGDILDFNLYKQYNPDIIIMSEITWYILDKLDIFIEHIKENYPNTLIIHLLTTYPKNKQKYGKEKIKNHKEIINYFNANYLEFGEIINTKMNGDKRTYFIANYIN